MKEIKLGGGKPFRGILRIAVRKPWKLRSRLENALYNRCVGSDEWLHLVSGTGTATLRGKRYLLKVKHS
jgi:hypothetical protein